MKPTTMKNKINRLPYAVSMFYWMRGLRKNGKGKVTVDALKKALR